MFTAIKAAVCQKPARPRSNGSFTNVYLSIVFTVPGGVRSQQTLCLSLKSYSDTPRFDATRDILGPWGFLPLMGYHNLHIDPGFL